MLESLIECNLCNKIIGCTVGVTTYCAKCIMGNINCRVKNAVSKHNVRTETCKECEGKKGYKNFIDNPWAEREGCHKC